MIDSNADIVSNMIFSPYSQYESWLIRRDQLFLIWAISFALYDHRDKRELYRNQPYLANKITIIWNVSYLHRGVLTWSALILLLHIFPTFTSVFEQCYMQDATYFFERKYIKYLFTKSLEQFKWFPSGCRRYVRYKRRLKTNSFRSIALFVQM